MEMLFLKLMNLSINASILIAAVLIFHLVFKKSPKWINCILWALVGIRLMIPFSLESSISLIPREEPIPSNIIHQVVPQLNTPSKQINEFVIDTLSSSPSDSVTKTGVLLFALGLIWTIGLIAMITYSIVSYLVLKRRLKTATLYADGIKQSELIDSPFVLGIIKPTIYIPYSLRDRDLEFVLLHEKSHIKRKDHLWKLIGFVILSVYWFNPLVWIAYIIFCRDIESACDEKVVATFDDSSRKDYSIALLNCSVRHRLISACPIAFGETGVKSRIKAVMNYKKPTFWVIVATILVVCGVFICFNTIPKSNSLIGKKIDISKANEYGFPLLEVRHGKDWVISSTKKITYTASGEEIPLNTTVISNVMEYNAISPGASTFSLRLGEPHSGDYKVSFDYYVTGDGSISFVMFDESNITYANDYLGDQYYWYRIEVNGSLLYETSFHMDDKYLSYDGQQIKIENYKTNVWNKVSLEVVGDRINLYMNNEFIASFDNVNETKSGCFALDATTQVLIKDIEFE